MSIRDEWGTPPELFDKLDDVFHFTLDVCATKENAKCERYYGPEAVHVNDDGKTVTRIGNFVDGLAEPWAPHVCWMNPPYSDPGPWLEKAYGESQRGATVVGPVPNDPSTRWWVNWAMKASQIVWLIGARVQFVSPPGIKASSNTSSSVVLVYWPEAKAKAASRQTKCFWNWKHKPFENRS